jgi:hypothetical protein
MLPGIERRSRSSLTGADAPQKDPTKTVSAKTNSDRVMLDKPGGRAACAEKRPLNDAPFRLGAQSPWPINLGSA